METSWDEIPVQPEGLFPYGFKREAFALWSLTWPLCLSILFHYLIQPISLAFCGHLGENELASVALAISLIYVTTVSIGRGLAFGGDTYFSQCYGSTNKMKMGVYLQKGLIFGVLNCFPIWAVLLNVRSILILIGQDPVISDMAQTYCDMFLPGVLAYNWLFLLMRYLLCQNRVMPNFFICVFACAVNGILHYILLYQFQMGLQGSAISLFVSYYIVFTLFVLYLWLSGVYKETWAGWTRECLEDWGDFGRTCLSSIAMTFLFWFCTEVGTYLGGILGNKELDAYSIMFQVEGFMWMIPLGFGGACTARLGQYLGSNQPLGALTVCRVTYVIIVVISVLSAVLVYGLKQYVPKLFTDNEEIADYTSSLFPILAIWLAIEGIGGVGVSIARGTGRQSLCASVVLVSYYVIALPMGIPLMFKTSLGLAGLWWGYVTGLSVQSILLLIFVICLDWNKEADLAQIRAGVVNVVQEENTGAKIQSEPVPEINEEIFQNAFQDSDQEALIISPRNSIVSLVLKRSIILLFGFLILIAGILIRVYVKVEVTKQWIPLCKYSTDTFEMDTNLTTTVLPYTIPPCYNHSSMVISLFIPS